MTANDYITDTTAQLTDWGIDYRETTEGLSAGNIHLEITEDGDRPVGTILNGTETVAITSDTDKASALLAFPLARMAWESGYMGDFKIDTYGGDLNMLLTVAGSDVTLSGSVDKADLFTVADHELFNNRVDMTDMDAVITATGLAYQNPSEAWQALCNSRDFESKEWQEIVEIFDDSVQFTEGGHLTKVDSSWSENIALVEGYGHAAPTRVIDMETLSDVTCWAPGDVAAAVLEAIS
jgi:hypothetical protein|uniref:Uncharacterized protein n=1 Tax=Siphoviridae sp. ctUWs1 TaxID=2826352 RepID=A0A8S5QUJ8_9CAUD|nr:MAG TPA: hypothetical protein [Siphoviridae sp. ctUWs1]